MFDIEESKEKIQAQEKTKQAEINFEYESYIRSEIKRIKVNLNADELQRIKDQATAEIGSQKRKFGHEKIMQLKMDEIIKNNSNLPSFDEWSSQKQAA